MFAKDIRTKIQILDPAFELVMWEGTKPVDFIAAHAPIATAYNRGEIPEEELGAELAKLRG
jgi:hypothetical protein